MDGLKKRAEVFLKMLDIKYHIIIGRKGKIEKVNLISKFNCKVNPASKMKAKYILESEINGDTFYVCIDSEHNADDYFCRSFFPRSGIDYNLGHTKYSLLRKEKIDVANKSKIVLLDKIPERFF